MTTNPLNNFGLFGCPTTYDALLDWCASLSGSEKIAAITAMHMALNLAQRQVQEAIDANTTTNEE